MKRKITYALICIVFVGGGISSCQKNDYVNSNFSQEMDAEKLTNEIISFREAVISPNQKKSGQTISLDSAIILMEASFNFHHCNYNQHYAERMYDSTFVDTEYNLESKLSINKVNEIYIEINNSIYEIFEACTYSNKTLKFIDIYFDSGYIKALIAIGNNSTQKAGSNPTVTLPTINNLWLGATPFNSQPYETWTVSDGYEHTDYSNGYFKIKEVEDTDVAVTLNSVINLPYDNSNTYIYHLKTYSIDNKTPYFSYESIYEYNADIAGPNEVDGNYANFFFLHLGKWDANINEWKYYNDYKNTNSNYYTYPKTRYRFMNKYYNLCLAFVPYLQTGDREAIDLTFYTKIIDIAGGPSERELSAKVKITYALNHYYPEHQLMSLEYIEK